MNYELGFQISRAIGARESLIELPYLLCDRPQLKAYGWVTMENKARASVMLQWDHEYNPFAGQPACLVVNDAPLSAWRRGDWSPWDTVIVFSTREGWKAAWRLARLLANALPERPALLDHDSLTAIDGLFPGPRTRCAFRLEEVER